MKAIGFECEDRYEAEKLVSLVSIHKDGSMWVTGVAALIEREIVIQLKDRSSHAVIMKSEQEARRLADILKEVVEGKAIIRTSESAGPRVEISLG